jgi:hypothetical protein
VESFDLFMPQASAFSHDNPQVEEIYVAPHNVKVIGIEPEDQEGKAIYSLKLKYHNSSYLCTKENKVKREIDMMHENKMQQGNECKETQRYLNHQICKRAC